MLQAHSYRCTSISSHQMYIYDYIYIYIYICSWEQTLHCLQRGLGKVQVCGCRCLLSTRRGVALVLGHHGKAASWFSLFLAVLKALKPKPLHPRTRNPKPLNRRQYPETSESSDFSVASREGCVVSGKMPIWNRGIESQKCSSLPKSDRLRETSNVVCKLRDVWGFERVAQSPLPYQFDVEVA